MANTEREWNLAVMSGTIRLLIGPTAILRRGQLARLGGAAADDSIAPTIVAALGVRDLGLAAASFAATKPGTNVAKTLQIHAINDVVDTGLFAAYTAMGRLTRWRGIALVVMGLFTAGANGYLASLAKRPAGLSING